MDTLQIAIKTVLGIALGWHLKMIVVYVLKVKAVIMPIVIRTVMVIVLVMPIWMTVMYVQAG